MTQKQEAQIRLILIEHIEKATEQICNQVDPDGIYWSGQDDVLMAEAALGILKAKSATYEILENDGLIK